MTLPEGTHQTGHNLTWLPRREVLRKCCLWAKHKLSLVHSCCMPAPAPAPPPPPPFLCLMDSKSSLLCQAERQAILVSITFQWHTVKFNNWSLHSQCLCIHASDNPMTVSQTSIHYPVASIWGSISRHWYSHTRGQDYKEKHKLDSKQISNSPC